MIEFYQNILKVHKAAKSPSISNKFEVGYFITAQMSRRDTSFRKTPHSMAAVVLSGKRLKSGRWERSVQHKDSKDDVRKGR